REGPIPHAERHRLTRAGSKAQRAAVDSVLSEFFARSGDDWHNKRADEEIAAHQAQASTNRRIARERTVPRIGEPIVSVKSNEPLNDSSRDRAPNQNQIPEPEKSKAKASARERATTLPDGFTVSERVRRWAASKGFDQLDRYLEFFVSKAKAKGYE